MLAAAKNTQWNYTSLGFDILMPHFFERANRLFPFLKNCNGNTRGLHESRDIEEGCKSPALTLVGEIHGPIEHIVTGIPWIIQQLRADLAT